MVRDEVNYTQLNEKENHIDNGELLSTKIRQNSETLPCYFSKYRNKLFVKRKRN